MPAKETSKKKPLSAGETSPHLKDYFQVLSARKWILVSCFVVVVVCTTVAVFTQTPIYRAECRLEIQPATMETQDVKAVYDPTLSGMAGEFIRHAFLETQYRLILANSVVEKTFRHFNLRDLPKFKARKNPEHAFRQLFEVEPVPDTWLADISFEWENPVEAADILNHLVDAYLKNYRTRNQIVDEDTLKTKRLKVSELQPQVEEKFQVLQQFIVDHNLITLEGADQQIRQHFDNLTELLKDAVLKSNEAGSRYENIQLALKEGRFEEMPEIFNNETIHSLKMEQIKAQIRLTELEPRFGKKHPEVKTAIKNLEFINEKIEFEKQCLLNVFKSEFDRAKGTEMELRTDLADEEKKIALRNQNLGKFQQLKKSYEDAYEKINSLKSDIADLELSLSGNEKEKNIQIVDRAKVPVKPVRPKKAISIILASAFGVILGLGLCFFIEYLDTTIKTKEDVERLLGTPVLGYVPPIGDSVSKNVSKNGREQTVIELSALDKPHSYIAEAFRSIRTALMFGKVGKGLKNILVTSPTPSEGKTLVSINLAMALAQAGKKVLVVDADLRKPRLARVLGISQEPGLSNVLAGKGEMPVERPLVPTHLENLTFLPSGPHPPNPAELLGSERMHEVVGKLSAMFDNVIYDTPPTVNATDAATLAQYIEGAVLVVRSFKTERDVALRARDILLGARVNILGTILNNADVPRNSYGRYYYYNKYYAYYSDDKTKRIHKRRRRKASSKKAKEIPRTKPLVSSSRPEEDKANDFAGDVASAHRTPPEARKPVGEEDRRSDSVKETAS